MSHEGSARLSPVEAGQTFIISGTTTANPERFNIDLKGDGDNIPFHLSVRFEKTGSTVIIRNTQAKGEWGQEEREQAFFEGESPNAIRGGSKFKIAIATEINMFVVSIDDKLFCKYKYRKPLKDITRISIRKFADTIVQLDPVIVKSTKLLDIKF